MHKKNKKIGIGGITCACCRPARTSKKEAQRLVNKFERRQAKKQVREYLAK